MTSVAQQLKESRWINSFFLSATEKRYELLAFVALMSWALAAPLAPFFLDHFYTYMISSTITSLSVAYIVCAKLLRRAAGMTQRQHTWREHFFLHPWHFFLAGMLLWSVISFFVQAEDKMRALRGGPRLREGLTAYCFYAMIYVISVWLTEEKKRRIVQLTMMIGSVIPAAVFWFVEFGFTSYQYGWFGDWLFIISNHRASIYLNSNYYGYYLTVILAITATCFVSAEKWRERLAAAVIFALNVMTLVANDTLGAFVAVLLCLILIPVLYSIRNKFRIIYLLPLVLFFGITMWLNFGVFWEEIGIESGSAIRNFMSLRADIANILEGNEDAASAGSGRWFLWQVTWDMMLKEPVFGCGPEQMVFYLEEMTSVPYNWPHNEYLQYAAMLGIPAGLMYLAALISLAVTQIRKVRFLSNTTLVAGCVAFGYAVSALFGGATYVTAPYIFMALGMTSLQQYREPQKQDEQSEQEAGVATENR